MNNILRPIVEETMGLIPMCPVFIDDEPIPTAVFNTSGYVNAHQNMIGEYFSLYVYDEQDLSEFWDKYNQIKHSTKWQVYLTLSEYKYF
jgi:hypothetical protein